VEGTDHLKPIIFDYFSRLFSLDNTVIDPGFFENIISRVSDEMNEKIIAPYIADDVRKAVFSIGDLKALGADGLHALFYKKFWHLVGNDITFAVLKAINDKVIPEGWNETVVILIPKVDTPEEVSLTYIFVQRGL
jgi:hypothetical protein